MSQPTRKAQRMWLLLQYNTDKVLITVVCPSGYLNENGHLNLAHFEKYLEKLSDVSVWNIFSYISYIFKKINTIILQRYINLIKYDSKDMYNVARNKGFNLLKYVE